MGVQTRYEPSTLSYMSRRVLLRSACLAGLVALASASACASDPAADASGGLGACTHVVWHKPSRPDAYVEIVGDWNGFARPGIVPVVRADGYRVAEIPLASDLPNGERKYAILEDGAWITDPQVATSAFQDGHEVSLLTNVTCGPRIEVTSLENGSLDAHLLNVAALDTGTLAVTLEALDGTALAKLSAAGAGADLHFAGNVGTLPRGRHELMIRARRADASLVAETRTSVWSQPLAANKRDLVIYQVIVDRFRSSDGSPLAAPQPASARAGGTLDGLRVFVESGELTRMGFNALWVSPLYQNPDGMWPGGSHEYSSYHGYWPVSPRTVDARLGGEPALDALVRAAHDRGIAVIVDVVPNHVHQQHPYATRAGFVRQDTQCVCGAANCDWSRHILDCWFAPYLPDLDWTQDDVARTVSSDVRWWFDRFGIDGIRIDAVPMMPRAGSRRMSAAVRDRAPMPVSSRQSTDVPLVLGENFTGPGGYASLAYHLGPQGLDSEFHFPLMWAIRGSVASERNPLSSIADAVLRGDEEWTGSGAVMGTMIGNHDVTRFASESDLSAGGDGWTPAPLPINAEVYAKQKLALSAIYTLPGMPIVYYGDEIALAGGADPDSRRVMPASPSWTNLQREVAARVTALGKARACSAALRRGTTEVIDGGPEHSVYVRRAEGDVAVVTLTRRLPADVHVKVPGISSGTYIDLLTGVAVSLAPAADADGRPSLTSELTLPSRTPFSASIFVPKGSACAP